MVSATRKFQARKLWCRVGNACQLFYEFKGKTGINMILNTQQKPVRIDIEKLAIAFKEGGIASPQI